MAPIKSLAATDEVCFDDKSGRRREARREKEGGRERERERERERGVKNINNEILMTCL